MSNLATASYIVPARDVPRMYRHIHPEPNSGCWLWGGPINSYGYGVMTITRGDDRRWLLAHRAVYVHERGNVAGDLCLDHKCRTRSCVNPDHLEPKTWVENIMMHDADSLCAVNARKSHCSRGHEYTDGNTYHRPDKPHTRDCLTCRRERSAIRNAKARGGRPAMTMSERARNAVMARWAKRAARSAPSR